MQEKNDDSHLVRFYELNVDKTQEIVDIMYLKGTYGHLTHLTWMN